MKERYTGWNLFTDATFETDKKAKKGHPSGPVLKVEKKADGLNTPEVSQPAKLPHR